MRHVLAAVSVIVVSVLLAMQWMPDAQAKKAKDPSAAIKKSASKAANKALKPFLRKIRASGKAAAKDLRALARAIEKGRPLPGTALAPSKDEPSDGVSTGIAILQIQLLLANAAAERRDEAGDATAELLDAEWFQELLRNNLTANDCLAGRGGTCDQIGFAIRSDCDLAIDTVNDAAAGVCAALSDLGVDVTARTFQLRSVTPIQALNQTGASLFPTQFEYAVCADLTVNGTVHIAFPAPSGNSTAYKVECHYAQGGLATATDLGSFTTPTSTDFTCSVPEPGLYRLVLISDCGDGCCAPADEQWMSVPGPATPSGAGGGGGLFDFDTSFATFSIDGAPAPDPVLNLASFNYDAGTLDRGAIYFSDATNGTRVLAVTFEWSDEPGTVTPKETIVRTPQSGTDPYVDFVHEDPFNPGTFYLVTTGPGKVADGTVEITFDRDVTEFDAGKPNVRVRGNVTVRALDMSTRTLNFDIGIARDDVSRSN